MVVEVHHVVMLQAPTCVPGSFPVIPGTFPGIYPGRVPGTVPGSAPGTVPGSGGQPEQPTPQPGIEDRMNVNMTMPKRPSRCVWAIVACCSPDSTAIRYSCFELLGCPGAFWGVNPCEPKVVQAAANTALNFYMSGGEDNPEPGLNNSL